MEGFLVPIISLAGALLGVVVGAFLTQRYQRRNTQSARLHEDRIDAYSGFIDAVVEYRRVHLDRAPSAHVADSTMWAAYYKGKLLAGDDRIVDAATETHALVRRLEITGLTDDELRRHAQASIGSLNSFVVAAREDVLSGRYADDTGRLVRRGHVAEGGP